uniref:C-type lectin domain-containing protein n=1 Tax=Anolis carolinensis TaxID=28377 RepID=G1KTH1_ANOCA
MWEVSLMYPHGAGADRGNSSVLSPEPLQWEEFGDSCYYFSDTTEQWENAKKICAAVNSHLIIINSNTEQNFVVQKIKQTSVWLGLHDTEVEGTWRWVDGSLLERNGYWKSGEPNDAHGAEDCAVLYKEKNWNDIPCDKNVQFVCEKSALS